MLSPIRISIFLSISLARLPSTVASPFLLARNNPPQPPCVYPYTKFVYSGCYQDAVYSRSLPFQAEMDFYNATVEQCTAYCKGNDYPYAGLEYYGQCFCGASVSSPAAPETDCNLPCNGDPSQACGGLDRLSIYQDPTFPDADDIANSSDYLSLGCYTEGTSGRSLDYSQWDYLNASAMTTETCLNACGAKGYPFAGTEFGQECYCGVVLGNGTLPADSEQCSTPCTGNSSQYCGGPLHLSLYVAKNLESTEPCAPPILSSSSLLPSSTPTPPPSSSTGLSTTSVKSSSTSPSTTSVKSTTSSKCYGWKCPTPTPCPTSTSKVTSSRKTTSKCTTKTSSTSKKTSTVKTTAKSTPKPTCTKHQWQAYVYYEDSS